MPHVYSGETKPFQHREWIKRKTLELRRLHHSQRAANATNQMSQTLSWLKPPSVSKGLTTDTALGRARRSDSFGRSDCGDAAKGKFEPKPSHIHPIWRKFEP
ncbi:hypothetical protein BDE40_2365 [Litoreibacter halocynthiae]|uniref:Uncharacterized protein n=1 Tax=Litoreibacter halocynthiae TaxID=1242689 RepID=A0A4R7LLS2_9RHOB|nr:hypothetical protein BDE40_2365 [Litoreibacter halocynthiae]